MAAIENAAGAARAENVRVASATERTSINVVLFSGGSGTHTITEALRKHRQISLKILINAYDDGHSTGRLRRFIPGMLGPSDVRKNINRLMPANERSQRSLKAISDYRLPVGVVRRDALAMLRRILDGDTALLPPPLNASLPQLTVWQGDRVAAFLSRFLAYFEEQEKNGRTFDFTDCALGNLLFAGCYLEEDRDFNRAIRAFSCFYEVDPGLLLNVTSGENLFLIAEKENGAMLLNEADIVAVQDPGRIRDLYLIDETTYRARVEPRAAEPVEDWRDLMRRANVVPPVNPAAAQAIAEADVIIYGPGTQHSSLFPSYMTAGLAECIAANTRADKVFIANIYRDVDIQQDDAGDIARKFLFFLGRKGGCEVKWRDAVSHFFVQQHTESELPATGEYVPFDESTFEFPLDTVTARDWEAQEGRHYGAYVLDEVRQIVQSRIDIELEPMHHTVSIVVPVLNEERTIESVLKRLVALDFQPFGLSKEIIVADGASTDKTVEIARSVRGVKVFSLPKNRGRGAAMRLGVDKARGNLIIFFPADNEYRPEDLSTVVGPLMQSNFKAVFATRMTKCTDLSSHLKQIYGGNRGLYLLSKYGGMLLSVMTLLLYNRYVTDMLSSVKGFNANLLRSLDLKSNGLDLESEIVAKLSRRREFLLEVPVDFKARTRGEGKKITGADGVRALLALFRFRFQHH